MSEILTKLRPDRDLQCYFERPSAIAALSGSSPEEFVLSGSWRQQFDWAVIEWNRDNVYEHPAFRNLPDGNLSGLRLTYREERTNCMAVDCDIYPTVDWPYLRIWASLPSGEERMYRVSLREHATPASGGYVCATAEFVIVGTPRAGDYVGLAWMSEHHTHQVYWDDTLDTIAEAICASVNAFSAVMKATRDGARIRLSYVGTSATIETSRAGANGNRIGVSGHVTPGSPLGWEDNWALLSGGASPTDWAFDIDFAHLTDVDGTTIPTSRVRKMRWTYGADFQRGEYIRSEFQVRVSDWNVTGSERTYLVAGPGSRRLEDDSSEIKYAGQWTQGSGNFSGGTIRYVSTPGATVRLAYSAAVRHTLYIGTRLAFNGTAAKAVVDGQILLNGITTRCNGEDTLIRVRVAELEPGPHDVTFEHDGRAGEMLYFDYFELASPVAMLPAAGADAKFTLATDWDTDHSIALAPERTAWHLHSLGFHGRANHYVGALWFYELVREAHAYAGVDVTFEGVPEMSRITQLVITRTTDPPDRQTIITRLNLAGETAAGIARAFELEINNGYTGIRAEVVDNVLRVYSRTMGSDGNLLRIASTPVDGDFRVVCSSPSFNGGADGVWRADLEALPRLNRAARDWSRAYFKALKGYGIPCVAAFSMELQHGDPTTESGIAQRYPDNQPVLLNTPALQTNFSPKSLEFWTEVYKDMARIQHEALVPEYLQFGEVQWWYFPNSSGMPFYDSYTRSRFAEIHGREMRVIARNDADPAEFADETSLLSGLIGDFTTAITCAVRTDFPHCRFEVLYPPDVNETALNTAVNFPSHAWTSASLQCLKTESFTYTLMRDLDASRRSIQYGAAVGFPGSQRSHLVGISDPVSPWCKEAQMAVSDGTESVVLFALDQFCLIGYAVPIEKNVGRSTRMG